MANYEAVLNQIKAVPTGAIGDNRTITWLTASKVIGVARNSRGHLELFLAGDELKPRSNMVRSAMHYHAWHRDALVPLSANRICLPAFGHFDQVGAFIAAELLRERAEFDLERAFAVTEPLIELAIKRMEISENALLGLVGELLLIDALCRRAADHQVGLIVEAWDGWRISARDFKWEGTGVEIKTTTHTNSSHVIQGIHQIEPTQSSDDTTGEVRLLLVSIGLRKEENDTDALSIPYLVQSIIEQLEASGASGLIDSFLTRVSVYCADSGLGYEHATMANDAPFSTQFSMNFVRGYDMADPAIQVLRRDDLIPLQHLDAQSVTFRVDLPAAINLKNPIVGARRVAEAILSLRR